MSALGGFRARFSFVLFTKKPTLEDSELGGLGFILVDLIQACRI